MALVAGCCRHWCDHSTLHKLFMSISICVWHCSGWMYLLEQITRTHRWKRAIYRIGPLQCGILCVCVHTCYVENTCIRLTFNGKQKNLHIANETECMYILRLIIMYLLNRVNGAKRIVVFFSCFPCLPILPFQISPRLSPVYRHEMFHMLYYLGEKKNKNTYTEGKICCRLFELDKLKERNRSYAWNTCPSFIKIGSKASKEEIGKH